MKPGRTGAATGLSIPSCAPSCDLTNTKTWPRGRIVFDRSRDVFMLYADRKLLTPAMIARIETKFQLPEERTEIQTDFHYQSKEIPNGLATDD
jgi:hypothetical protein